MDRMTNQPADDPYRGLPRIGDAERQAAVDALSDHFVAGRLDQDEFNQRMETAMQARTRAELAPLFADLPPLGGFGPAPEHQQLAPMPSPYEPAPSPPPASVPATSSGRSRIQTLELVRTLVWPVAIGLWIFTGISFWVLLGAAILTSVVVSKLLEQEKASGGSDVPPEWRTPDDGDQPPQIGPGGPPKPPRT